MGDELYPSEDEIYYSDDDSNEEPMRKPSDMDQMSIFCNKYETDLNLPTVVNKMADMVIDLECRGNMDSIIEDYFEMEYEDVEFENAEVCPIKDKQLSTDVGDEIYISDDEEMEGDTSEEGNSYHEYEEQKGTTNILTHNQANIGREDTMLNTSFHHGDVEAQTLTLNRTFVKSSFTNAGSLQSEEMPIMETQHVTLHKQIL